LNEPIIRSGIKSGSPLKQLTLIMTAINSCD
jgi:hypothetical protein